MLFCTLRSIFFVAGETRFESLARAASRDDARVTKASRGHVAETRPEDALKKLKIPAEARNSRRHEIYTDLRANNVSGERAEPSRAEHVEKKMLGADADQGASNGVIVSHLANSHAPQDFTVSRLLSTPTHALGK